LHSRPARGWAVRLISRPARGWAVRLHSRPTRGWAVRLHSRPTRGWAVRLHSRPARGWAVCRCLLWCCLRGRGGLLGAPSERREYEQDQNHRRLLEKSSVWHV
jgi:hypothetical protein